ncbi:hypothetical protein M569_09195 [Genlisea aurea]|uniref:Large ribosomal RNA subunit accumulation protein YCED homolog 1, chloroplastic n=1 Tax=Genlisea aurea TaxID=192259 RepID=S8CF70_9LAMI|nr:hypothetical protein M569_09195 [Genlisea aurea]
MLLPSSFAISSPTVWFLPPTSILVERHRPFSHIGIKASIPSILAKTHRIRTDFDLLSEEPPGGSEWGEFVDEIGEDDDEDDEGTPWEGAILYRRNAAVSHLEYSTTLERLGLGKVSSEASVTRASEMGLSLVNPSKEDSAAGTPVLISADVTRRKRALRLDGIVRTVLALNCYRCGETAAQSIFSDFSLLLCEEPIPEPDDINMSRDQNLKKAVPTEEEESKEDEDDSIEVDDRLYFPRHEKAIDISKNIRDLIHVEINISAVCDPNCRGLCLKCGANRNVASCGCCDDEDDHRKGFGPLGHLRDLMQKRV